jgi:hypothetical protein
MHYPARINALVAGFTESAVVAHPYYGTQAVLDDLARLPGWGARRVSLSGVRVRRDPRTGVVVGMEPYDASAGMSEHAHATVHRAALCSAA